MSTPDQAASLSRTSRTVVKRRPQRAAYDRKTVDSILDEALLCHVGFVADGQPYVLPTIHARRGDVLYLHGSAANHMLRTLADGVQVCVTVSIVDGLVLARSAFHHSMNYRSVVLLGRAVAVEDPAEQLVAFEAIVDHVVPGRWPQIRPPNPHELKASMVLKLAIDEGSAKVRAGGPIDDEADLSLPVWAGTLPLRLVPQAPIAHDPLATSLPVPAEVRDWPRSTGRSSG